MWLANLRILTALESCFSKQCDGRFIMVRENPQYSEHGTCVLPQVLPSLIFPTVSCSFKQHGYHGHNYGNR